MKRRGFLGLLAAVPLAPLVAKEKSAPVAPNSALFEGEIGRRDGISFHNCPHTSLNCECNPLPRPALEFTADTNTGILFTGEYTFQPATELFGKVLQRDARNQLRRKFRS